MSDLRALSLTAQFVLLLVAGGLFTLGFAPFSLWPLALLTLALLLYCCHGIAPKRALLLGLAFGIGQFVVGVSWIYVSMVNFGNVPPIAAVAAVLIVVLYLAIYPALACYAFTKLQTRRSAFNLTLLAPAVWVSFEALRGYLFTGFPWLTLGYAGLHTPLVELASVGGVLLVSFALAVSAGLLVTIYLAFNHRKQGLSAVLISAVLLMVLWMGSWALQSIQWVSASGENLKVAMVQRNIPLAMKWQPEARETIQNQYLEASKQAQQADSNIDLILWPEAALPQVYDEVSPGFLAHLSALKPAIAFGVIERQASQSQQFIYNSMVLLGAAEKQEQLYRKDHLVPFGEFFPLKWLLSGLLAQLQVPMSDMSSWGAQQSLLQINGLKLLATICYEDAFPEDWRNSVSEADILLNISEDAWFGDSFAPHQRLEMARFRAIEMGRELIRVSNSGLSTIIRVDGSYDKVSPQFSSATVVDEATAYQGVTPYNAYGRVPLYLLFLFIVYRAMRLRKDGPKEPKIR